MTDGPELTIVPMVAYPKVAESGRSYLMTVDLTLKPDETWPLSGEEIEIGLVVDASPRYTSRPLGTPSVVLHRFGGTYGRARFVLTAGFDIGDASISLTMLNPSGVPVKALHLPSKVQTKSTKWFATTHASGLRLEAGEVTGPRRWLWRLYDADGSLIAFHQVTVDTASWEWHAMNDLAVVVAQQTDPGDTLNSQAALVASVGRYTTEGILGPVANALAEAAPVTVTVVAPAGQPWLLGLPLSIAVIDGKSLAARRVSFAGTLQGQQTATKERIGERLRVLAVYSVPAGQALLDLRRERKGLTDLVGRLTGSRAIAIDLRVLQYGATAERLQDALSEDDGWDIVHLSGHGNAGHIVLEDATGRPNVVDTAQLVKWLSAARYHLKLVSLSANSSAAFTVTQTLRDLGIETMATEPAPVPPSTSLGLALEIAQAAHCTVVAMRYPVIEDFAVEFTLRMFEGLWDKYMDAATAFGWAVQQAALSQPGAPAMSAYTPAIFGAAAGLRVSPPRATTVEPVDTAMAAFEPEPARFVGRISVMTRANAALATASGRSGVIFHGMSGAGKTACALELAYGQRDNFARLIWAKAPPDTEGSNGGDLRAAATTLTNLAGRLDLALGVALADKIHDASLAAPALEELAEAMRMRAVLVVIDNAESLLTATGAWLDTRWQNLVDALTRHGGRGLGRLVITTRRPPTRIAASMAVEVVHALNRDEAILLARQLPNLARLLAEQSPVARSSTYQLVRSILEVTGGHPKLLELADARAATPRALQAMLSQAEEIWDRAGIKPTDYLGSTAQSASDQGDPVAGYVNVLQGWTAQAVAGLNPPELLVAQMLCRCDPADRTSQILEANFADLWLRLGQPDPCPDYQTLLDRLAAVALIEIHQRTDLDSYDIHPVVGATIARTTPVAVTAAVDHELAAYWSSVAEQALVAESAGLSASSLVVSAARQGVTYLLRLEQWDTARSLIETALRRDTSPAGQAEALTLLRNIAEQTAGTDTELPVLATLAKALAATDPDQAEQLLHRVEIQAAATDRHQLADVAAGDLANLLQGRGRYRDALEVIDRRQDHIRRAGLGPWTQLADQVQRLQLEQRLGDDQQVLTTIAQLTDHLSTLPDPPAANETVVAWNVRETLFTVAASAAQALRRWDDALSYHNKVIASQEARGAPRLELARTRFGAYSALLRTGRTGDARVLLDECRAVFETHDDYPLLAMCLTAYADLEDDLGHGLQAVDLERVALRLKYLQPDPDTVAMSHYNLASYVARWVDDADTSFAHRLAAATIRASTGSGYYRDTLRQVAAALVSGVTPPADFETLCAIVERTDGVHFHELIDTLGVDGDQLLAAIVDQAHALPVDQVYADQLAAWETTLSLLVAANTGNTHARTHLDRDLDQRAKQPDWAQLTARLTWVRDGERDPATLTANLAPVDAAIITRSLDALTGHTILDPAPETLRPLLAAVVGRRHRKTKLAPRHPQHDTDTDTDTDDDIDAALDQMAASDDWAALATQLRGLAAGRATIDWDDLDRVDTAIVASVVARLDQPGLKR